jgi:O-antigen/teichoic acid export membrane protein
MLLIALGRIAQLFLIFVTVKISTTLLPPAEMAKVFLVASIVAFYAMLLLNPVGMFMNRRLHAWNEMGKVQHYYNYFWLYLLAVCGVAETTLWIFVGIGWVSIHSTTVWTLLLVGGSLLFTTTNQVVIPGLNLLGFRGWFVALSLATAISGLVVAIVFVVAFSPRAEYWMIGLLVGQLLFAAVGWKVFFYKLKSNRHETLQKPTKRHISALVKFAWPISIAVGLGWAQSQGYRFMMESNLGLHALGLFAAGYGISAGLISAFESVFTTYLQPIFYKNISNDNVLEQSKAWSEYAGTIFPSLMLAGFVILACAPELTHAMLGAEYWPSSQYIVWGVVAELARVASGIYGMIAHARMKTRLLLLPSLAGATSSITLIWWLMPMYASNGVGAALMVSSVSVFVLTYAATRKEYETTFPHKMLIASIGMGIGLILMAEMLRLAVEPNGGFIVIAAQLFVVGMLYLIGQYLLLQPILKERRALG